jgi:hypothetical protein
LPARPPKKSEIRALSPPEKKLGRTIVHADLNLRLWNDINCRGLGSHEVAAPTSTVTGVNPVVKRANVKLASIAPVAQKSSCIS